MTKKIILLSLCSLLLAQCFEVEAQQPKKVPRIAFLSTTDRGSDFTRFEGIQQRRDLGYIEGQNIAIEYRSAGGKLDRYQELAAELVRLGVDIIVVGGGTVYVQAVKNATKSIPIVMTGPGADPVETGLVKSLARPGGNVTGVTTLAEI
jgi:putative ABC transport system substrate-binding protein